MLRCGLAETVVVGGAESLSRFHLNGFNTLMILDRRPCRPFDADRAGLNLGEGAAYLVMETAASVSRRGVRPLCSLDGYANACDAFHQTASSPNREGAFLAMTEALHMAGLEPADIQYVNAHGTGTLNNDASESNALKRVFGATLPAVSSTKAFTGHTTSASGSIEATICLLALQHQFVPVNLNWQQPMEDGIIPFTGTPSSTPLSLHHVMCNSFGFGGNDTSFVLSRKEEGRRRKEITSEIQDSKGSSQDSFTQDISPFSFLLRPSSNIYIRSAAQISIQQPLCDNWMEHPLSYDTPFATAIDPDFRTYMNPLQSRRMGKVLKRALVTSQVALNEAQQDHLDAIMMGTGMGCWENTERFLEQMCREGESLLKPTYFMQSTHNTISSMLGIQLRCHGYNTTYSHGKHSFDSALLDAFMQLKNGEISNALVCANDELTPAFCAIMQQAGIFGQPGQWVTGEGSVSMVLTTDPEGAWCEMVDISMDNDGLQDADDFSWHDCFGGGFLSSAFGVYAAATCLAKGKTPNGQPVEELQVVNQKGEQQVTRIHLKKVICD